VKVKIKGYVSWFGPYQLAEFICFWAKSKPDEHGFPRKADYVHNFGEWLAHGNITPKRKVGDTYSLGGSSRKHTKLAALLQYIHDKKERRISVRIDPYDTWAMDHTLSYIILPMLIQLKEKQHGAPFVDDCDVPVNLQSTNAPPKENEWDTDDNHFKRWDWVLDEMIFAFTAKQNDDWESQFYSGEHDICWKKLEDGNSRMVKGPNNTFTIDKEGRNAFAARMANGFKLFGRYYENLWD
jgi:hypothetical protein